MPKPWGRYEIDYINKAKFLALTGNAIALWWEAKNYCDKHHTDGLFPREALRTFRFNGGKSVQLLTRSCGLKPNGTPYAPLWETTELGGIAYYRMHDYLDHNDCHDAVQERLDDAEDRAMLRRLQQAKRKRDERERRRAQIEAMLRDVTQGVTPMSRAESVTVTHHTEASAEAETETSVLPSVGRQPRMGSKRPIYQSDRFVVFEWQLDRLSETLGPHVDDFDLHSFFDDLSKQSRDRGLVIPMDRDARWAWLQGEVLAEVRRRGLPIASAPSVSPTNKRIDGLMKGGEAFLRRQA